MPSEESGAGESVVARCSLCGQVGRVVELPEEPGKYCFSCSADVATAILLTTEIDAATLAGRASNTLVAEFRDLTDGMLRRCQGGDRTGHFRPLQRRNY
jgi:hypothetical protein